MRCLENKFCFQQKMLEEIRINCGFCFSSPRYNFVARINEQNLIYLSTSSNENVIAMQRKFVKVHLVMENRKYSKWRIKKRGCINIRARRQRKLKRWLKTGRKSLCPPQSDCRLDLFSCSVAQSSSAPCSMPFKTSTISHLFHYSSECLENSLFFRTKKKFRRLKKYIPYVCDVFFPQFMGVCVNHIL